MMEFLRVADLLEAAVSGLKKGDLAFAQGELIEVAAASGLEEASVALARQLLKAKLAKSHVDPTAPTQRKPYIPPPPETQRSVSAPDGVPTPKPSHLPRPNRAQSPRYGTPELPPSRDAHVQQHADLRKMQFDAYSSPPSHLKGADLDKYNTHQKTLRGHLKTGASGEAAKAHANLRKVAGESKECVELLRQLSEEYGADVKRATMAAHSSTKAAFMPGAAPAQHAVAHTMHRIARDVAQAAGHSDLADKHGTFMTRHAEAVKTHAKATQAAKTA